MSSDFFGIGQLNRMVDIPYITVDGGCHRMGTLALQCIDHAENLIFVKFGIYIYFLNLKNTFRHCSGLVHHHILDMGKTVQKVAAFKQDTISTGCSDPSE